MGHCNFQTTPEDDEGMKVLLVDKDTNSLMYMSSVLEEHSYIVTTTTLAFIGLSMVLESRIKFDVIICEIDMPGINGFEFMKQITSKAEIPIFLISESEDIELNRRAINEGAGYFYHKPIAKHNLSNIYQIVIRCNDAKGLILKPIRDMEKQYEALHDKGKSSSSNRLEMENPKLIGSSSPLPENENPDIGPGNYFTIVGKRNREDDEYEMLDKDKTQRLIWTTTLQQKFKDAYEALGETRATPTKIMELMCEPELTPQHISSYLQKYRAKLKVQSEKEEAAKAEMAKSMSAWIHRGKSCLGGYSTLSPNSSAAPYQWNHQLNFPNPNLLSDVMLNRHNISGDLMPNASVSNFRANTTNNFTHTFGQGIQGNIFPGYHPMELNPEPVFYQNNVGGHQFLPELNGGLGMAGDIFGTSQTVPGGNGVGQVHGGGLGLKLDLPKTLTREEIDNMLLHRYRGEDYGMDAASPDGYGSASSVTQPLMPHTRYETSSDEEGEDATEKFLNMENYPGNSDADDGFFMP